MLISTWVCSQTHMKQAANCTGVEPRVAFGPSKLPLRAVEHPLVQALVMEGERQRASLTLTAVQGMERTAVCGSQGRKQVQQQTMSGLGLLCSTGPGFVRGAIRDRARAGWVACGASHAPLVRGPPGKEEGFLPAHPSPVSSLLPPGPFALPPGGGNTGRTAACYQSRDCAADSSQPAFCPDAQYRPSAPGKEW